MTGHPKQIQVGPNGTLATGGRVFLRRPTMRDEGAFLSMVRESRGFHRPWGGPPQDAKSFGLYIQRVRKDDFLGTFVCRIEDGAIAGVINVGPIERRALQSAYAGYYAAKALAGQGYMTEGMGLVLGYAFGELKLHRIEANIQPANEKSIALVKRCGFRYEGFSPRYLKIGGRWRDHERWAILAEEWRGKRRRKISGKKSKEVKR
jgi:ribosomal-protein-alanine N-acetyltransferase